jgi:hypothetical protein
MERPILFKSFYNGNSVSCNEHKPTLVQELKLGDSQYVVWFDELRMTDVSRVGGKNASLGEMISQLTKVGVRVPRGFATTADAYRAFLAQEGLEQRISGKLATLDTQDVRALADALGRKSAPGSWKPRCRRN